MENLRAILRIFAMIPILVIFTMMSVGSAILIRDKSRRRGIQAQLVSYVCAQVLKLMNVRVSVIDESETSGNYMLIGNHLGFVDIFVVSSIKPSLFITSVDMRETPGLGHITDMGACLYVDRNKRSNIYEEIAVIRNALKEGHNVVLFPEAKANDGVKVYPFKRSLVTAAAGTGIPILPMVLNYRQVNGEPMSDKWRDYICWYGDQGFFGAAWKAFSVKSVDVELRFLPSVFCHTDEQRKEIAGILQTQVESYYIPIPRPESVSVH